MLRFRLMCLRCSTVIRRQRSELLRKPSSARTNSEMTMVPTPASPGTASGSVPEQEPAVRIVGLHKRFGEVAALGETNLIVRQGEFFTLLGPSGSGKTTLLRLIAGFEQPDGGT